MFLIHLLKQNPICSYSRSTLWAANQTQTACERAVDHLQRHSSPSCLRLEYWPCRSGWRRPGTRSAAPGWCPWRLASRSGSRFRWWCGRWWWAAAPSPRGCAAADNETQRQRKFMEGYERSREYVKKTESQGHQTDIQLWAVVNKILHLISIEKMMNLWLLIISNCGWQFNLNAVTIKRTVLCLWRPLVHLNLNHLYQ